MALCGERAWGFRSQYGGLRCEVPCIPWPFILQLPEFPQKSVVLTTWLPAATSCARAEWKDSQVLL